MAAALLCLRRLHHPLNWIATDEIITGEAAEHRRLQFVWCSKWGAGGARGADIILRLEVDEGEQKATHEIGRTLSISCNPP